MRRLYHFVPVLALCFGLPGGFEDVVVLEGKANIRTGSGVVTWAPFLVEGTVFQMRGEPLSAFAREHGPGDYVVQVEGDFDLRGHKVVVKRIALKERL